MCEFDSKEDFLPVGRPAMERFWMSALVRLQDYIARENRANEPMTDPPAPPEQAPTN